MLANGCSLILSHPFFAVRSPSTNSLPRTSSPHRLDSTTLPRDVASVWKAQPKPAPKVYPSSPAGNSRRRSSASVPVRPTAPPSAGSPGDLRKQPFACPVPGRFGCTVRHRIEKVPLCRRPCRHRPSRHSHSEPCRRHLPREFIQLAAACHVSRPTTPDQCILHPPYSCSPLRSSVPLPPCRYRPRGDRARIVREHVDCSPCLSPDRSSLHDRRYLRTGSAHRPRTVEIKSWTLVRKLSLLISLHPRHTGHSLSASSTRC